MHRRVVGLLVLVMVVSGLLAGCGATATPTTAPTAVPTSAPTAVPTQAPTAVPTAVPAGGVPADAALKVTGKVGSPIGWSEADVKAMKTLEVEAKNKQGQVSKYTGVLVKDLLALAKPASDATTVVFVASDGFTAEIELAKVTACTNCIVSFRDQGGFSTVLPDEASSLQVKGVVEIQVK